MPHLLPRLAKIKLIIDLGLRFGKMVFYLDGMIIRIYNYRFFSYQKVLNH